MEKSWGGARLDGRFLFAPPLELDPTTTRSYRAGIHSNVLGRYCCPPTSPGRAGRTHGAAPASGKLAPVLPKRRRPGARCLRHCLQTSWWGSFCALLQQRPCRGNRLVRTVVSRDVRRFTTSRQGLLPAALRLGATSKRGCMMRTSPIVSLPKLLPA